MASFQHPQLFVGGRVVWYGVGTGNKTSSFTYKIKTGIFESNFECLPRQQSLVSSLVMGIKPEPGGTRPLLPLNVKTVSLSLGVFRQHWTNASEMESLAAEKETSVQP